MKIMKPDAVLLDSKNKTPYEQIELAGRTCYKSEDSITEDSAVKFCATMKKNGHFAMLEHAAIHLLMDVSDFVELRNVLNLYTTIDSADNTRNTFIHSTLLAQEHAIVTGTLRSFYELCQAEPSFTNVIGYALKAKFPEIFDDFVAPLAPNSVEVIDDDKVKEMVRTYGDERLKDSILSDHIMHTMKFTCDRGVSHEFVRHRPASFAQESTRYCNYSKGKFGGEIAVIEPFFYEPGSEAYNLWKEGCEHDEKIYFKLLELGRTPQEARDNLPTSTKTDIIITANETEWQHIIDLRYHGKTGKPHPQMKEVMDIAYPLLVAASDNRLK